MQTLSDIRTLLAERCMHPKHKLGQNFLHDKNQLGKLMEAAQVGEGDLVLEVGPGTGTLTEALLEAGAHVIACEIDTDMADLIDDRLSMVCPTQKTNTFTLIRGDCLDKGRVINPAIVKAIAGREFKLVANLPYQIASPLMTTLLIDHSNCIGQYITIQREVADRLLAKPSTKAYGPLSIIVQAFAEV
ncbi:MAG: rRNA adenine dimethyltransferase family protein, partial [Planctomycetota bacterium]|nr:rRNA adenine dimethyltransferase family protein [Planctomycetota bacterium]